MSVVVRERVTRVSHTRTHTRYPHIMHTFALYLHKYVIPDVHTEIRGRKDRGVMKRKKIKKRFVLSHALCQIHPVYDSTANENVDSN